MNKKFAFKFLGVAIVISLTLLSTAITLAAVPSLPNRPVQGPTPTPPLPTWTPGIGPTKTPFIAPTLPPPTPPGGFIQLHVKFSPSSLQRLPHWQDLWTVVQWQDAGGRWHDVQGWQGTLDSIAASGDQAWLGEKIWWLTDVDLGKGPFRWLIYTGQDGTRLLTSEPFHLPDSKGEIVPVEVSLEK